MKVAPNRAPFWSRTLRVMTGPGLPGLCLVLPGVVQAAGVTAVSWSYDGNASSAQVGSAVAGGGDLNGDGYPDLAVGSAGSWAGASSGGAVLVFFGGADGLSASPAWTFASSTANARLGSSVSIAPDVNGDGYDDLLVGAPDFTSGEGLEKEGQVLLFLGGSAGPATTPSQVWTSGQAYAHLGAAVAGVGDVDGDGFGDIALGMPDYESSDSDTGEGAVWLFTGGSSGLASSPDWQYEATQPNAGLGSALAALGDLNGDGLADFGVAAPEYDAPQVDAGAVFVIFGASSGAPVSGDYLLSSVGQEGGFSGTGLSGGDFNGDGFDDLILGAPSFDQGDLDVGGAFLFLGTSSGVGSAYVSRVVSSQRSSDFGAAVAVLPDFDGDGLRELAVGSPHYDGGLNDEGSVAIFPGSSTGLSSSPLWTLEGNDSFAYLGQSLAALGDLNGDGCGELAVGAPGLTDPEGNEGRVLVISGQSADLDGDGFCQGDGSTWTCAPGVSSCAQPRVDCAPTDPAIFPGAQEIPADGVDQDCDGKELCFVDDDQDGSRGTDGKTVASSDFSCQSDGLADASVPATDCDDSSAQVNTEADETCNDLDDNCNGVVDEGAEVYYIDRDQDGYGDPSSARSACGPIQGFVSDGTDCDDTDLNSHPGALEVPGDERDQDCDGQEKCFEDHDLDGYRSEDEASSLSTDLDCDDPEEASQLDPGGDCNDLDPAFNPAVLETCDEIDNNCDDQIDNGIESSCRTGDYDGDGLTEAQGDCEDEDAAVNTQAEEACDGVDNDCDSLVDDGDVCAEPGACACATLTPTAPTSSGTWLWLGLGVLWLGRRRMAGGRLAE